MIPSFALDQIRDAIDRMNVLYGRTVFDEWALIAVENKRGVILGYEGPRRETFATLLAEDLRLLRAELEGHPPVPGHFGFAREAPGTAMDAFIIAGPSIYLLLNHTRLSVREIAADPRWRRAQVPFAGLAERFGVDPVNPGEEARVA